MSNKIEDLIPDISPATQGTVTQHIGKYEIQGMLGRGSTGVVYLGFDPQLKRKVAIKALHVARAGAGESPSSFQSNQNIVKRFLSEAQSTGKLRHQNIIALHEGDAHGPIPFLVMEYVEGATLDAYIKSGKRYAIPDLLLMLHQLADAIDYAHSQGVLHRDIKPANILIDANNKPYILDFGVAKIHEQISAEDEGVRATSVLGTPAYMSPEQIRNKPLNNQSDLFAFAIVVFQCLCGVRPFDGDTFTAVAASIIEKAPKKVVSFRPDLSAAVDQVFAQALAKDRAGRYESAQEFINALDAALKKPVEHADNFVADADVPAALVAKDIKTVRTLASRAANLNSDKLEDDSEYQENESAFVSKAVAVSKAKPPEITSKKIEGSSLMFFLFFFGMVVGVGCIGAYFFWPRRTVVLIAGQEAVNPGSEDASAETEPSSQEEEAISRALIRKILTQGSDSEEIPQLVSQLKYRSVLKFDLDVTPLLPHPSYLVKVAALKILIDRKVTSATEDILPLLDDKDPIVRGFAAKALGVLATKGYSKILGLKASNETVPEVIRALENAIDRIGEREQ